MPAASISVDELIALLKKTSWPTLLVEGNEDIVVYRTFEADLAHLKVSVMQTGGRSNLLEIFTRRAEIPSEVKLAFIADRDFWIHVNVPAEFSDPRLIFTDGYSVENDIYRDGMLWRMLTPAETGTFDADLNRFVRWYALVVSRQMRGHNQDLGRHPNQILFAPNYAALTALAQGEPYPQVLFDDIVRDHQRIVRGKSLFGLLLGIANRRPIAPTHSEASLLESVALRPGPLLISLRNSVEQLLR